MNLSANVDFKVLKIDEVDQILEFERESLRGRLNGGVSHSKENRIGESGARFSDGSVNLEDSGLDELGLQMKEWSSPWRKESLEHYLPLGWSMAAWDGQKILGYYLAQPILFLAGQTQTFWVEHIFSEDLKIGRNLFDVAYRTAREKHMQKVFFNYSVEPTAGVDQSELSRDLESRKKRILDFSGDLKERLSDTGKDQSQFSTFQIATTKRPG